MNKEPLTATEMAIAKENYELIKGGYKRSIDLSDREYAAMKTHMYDREAYLKGAGDMAEKVKSIPASTKRIEEPDGFGSMVSHTVVDQFIDDIWGKEIDACLEEMGKEGNY